MITIKEQYLCDHNTMSWTTHTEELVKSWGEKAAGLKWMHSMSARVWSKLSTRLSLYGIGVSAIGSALSFASANSTESVYLMYSAGAVALLSSFIQSVKKMYNADENAAHHTVTAKKMGALYRTIALQLSLDRSTRQPVQEFSSWASNELNQLQVDAPEIPEEVVSDFKKAFTDVDHVPDIAQDNFVINVHDV